MSLLPNQDNRLEIDRQPTNIDTKLVNPLKLPVSRST